MNRWEIKYQVVRAGRWAGRRLVTAAVVATILLCVAACAWLIQLANLTWGVDQTIFVFVVLVICAWFCILDHVLWD